MHQYMYGLGGFSNMISNCLQRWEHALLGRPLIYASGALASERASLGSRNSYQKE